jgi:hypothetical protein
VLVNPEFETLSVRGLTSLRDGLTVAGAATVAGNGTFSGTGSLKIPSGTIAQRPGTPAAGMIRHNTDSARLEYYNGTAWVNFTVDALEVEYLLVAGGGGGSTPAVSFSASGGGGAGGYRTNVGGTALTLSGGTTYTVIVGAGGAIATSGADSQFGSIQSAGGGYGTIFDTLAISGGSGGACISSTLVGSGNVPSTSPAQGNDSGTGGGTLTSAPNRIRAGGGGGGAGAIGGNGTTTTQGGIGGAGSANTITGSSVTYAGGGGGGFGSESTAGLPGGAGGTGGGGDGAGQGVASSAGGANTGGGGGGGGSGTGGILAASAGGSGIVIIRYLGAPRCTGGTITAGTGSAAGYTIHEFTTSGTFALTA